MIIIIVVRIATILKNGSRSLMSKDVISTKVVLFSIIGLIILISLTLLSIVMYPQYAYETIKIDVNDSSIITYSDKINKGSSDIAKINEFNSAGFDCEIKEGHPYPYCLTQLNFTNYISKGIDLSSFYKMRVYGTYSSPHPTDFLRIVLMNYHPDYSKSGNVHTYKYNLIELQSKDLEFPIEINLSDLNVPLWWVSDMRKKNVDTHVDLTNIPTIELATGTQASLGIHRLRVSKIEFDAMIITINELYEYIIYIWGVIFFLFVSITMTYLLIYLKKTKSSEQNLIAINDVLSVKSAELELISKHDELTGLLNRTGLKSKMIECLDKKLYPLTVVMIDIDYFKRINDRFGHQKGDIVLSQLGELLRDFTQGNESVTRFGGEEFIILMPEKSIDDVLVRLDKLRIKIEQSDMHIDQQVTASFGLASSEEYSGIKNLIDSADTALYKAKHEGRNCIRISV